MAATNPEIPKRIGDVIHQLHALTNTETLTRSELIAQQILLDGLEEAGLKISMALKGELSLNNKVIAMNLYKPQIEGMEKAWLEHGSTTSHYLTLVDNGYSFRILLCHDETDAARSIYECETLQNSK